MSSSKNRDNDIEEQEEKKELAPGVILYKEYQKVSNNSDVVGIFIWKVELTTMSVVDFEVNLEQSENIVLENKIDNELKTINKILPFEKKEVAKVILKDNWKLKSRFKLTMNVPDKSIQYNYIQKDEKLLEKNINENRNFLSKIPFEHLSLEEINSELKKQNIKFIDLDFLPSDELVIGKYDNTMKEYLDYIIHWRRPEDFITNDLITENISEKELRIFNNNGEPEPNDIHQGLLPDNHLVSAFSALAEKYNLIKRLFKSEKYNNFGIYQIKLCVAGEWITIIIDDLFPCIPLSPPLVSRSQSNELWILILEKAMAKIYDCYYNLTNVNIVDFLMVLTGCPTLFFSIEDELRFNDKEKLIKQLKNFVVDKKYLTVAISKIVYVEGDENNNNNEILEDDMLTIPNFGYTIIDVKNKYKDNFITLRKVWYDGSKDKAVQAYEENFIKEYPYIENEINLGGTLILKFDDFLKEFSSFAVCYAKNWDEVRIRGKFVSLKESENLIEVILSKWYYCIQLEKTTNIIISLFQDEDKFKEYDTRKQLMDISLTILKQDVQKNEISHLQTLDFSITSNIQTELNLPPGQYIILPRTSGCLFGRPFDKPIPETTPIFNYEEKIFSNVFINTIKDIFKKFDLLLNRKLGYVEFKGFYEAINKDSISENEFEEKILNVYQSHEGGLTEKGFIDFFEDNFKSEDGEQKVRNWLKLLGYDSELYPIRSRNFMITFHSDSPINVNVRDAINTDLNSKVDKIILKSLGEEIKKKKEISVIQYQSKFSNIISVGCVNKGNINYKVCLTFNDNGGLIFGGKKSKIEKIVYSGSDEFFVHFYLLADVKGTEGIDFSLEYSPVN